MGRLARQKERGVGFDPAVRVRQKSNGVRCVRARTWSGVNAKATNERAAQRMTRCAVPPEEIR